MAVGSRGDADDKNGRERQEEEEHKRDGKGQPQDLFDVRGSPYGKCIGRITNAGAGDGCRLKGVWLWGSPVGLRLIFPPIIPSSLRFSIAHPTLDSRRFAVGFERGSVIPLRSL